MLATTVQSQFPIDDVDKSIDTDIPGRVRESELRRVQLEAVSYFSIDDSLATFAKWALATFVDHLFGVAFTERQAYGPDAFNGKARIGSCGDFACIRK